ncbi:MAG: phenylalanine--tRNA ligase subunit beta, partial [Bacillota bacterium]
MLVPLEWLREYTDINVSLEEYLSRMTMCGVGVEGVEEAGAAISGVVTGKILSLEKHPDADRLQVCQVDIKDKTLQVVTGAPNVYEGAVIPVATHGARLPGGSVIKKGKMRGVVSEGMLCSGAELQLGEEDVPGAGVDGILILPEDTATGEDIINALGLGGVVVDFEVYANRPDRQSIIGIARETAAALETQLRLPEVRVENTLKEKPPVRVTVEDADLCPRYMARVVKNVRIKPSPGWMQKRLKQAGVRPINNIVDVTNYVMLEMGQPMHAFDLACVHDKAIIVRRAQAGEAITSLDGRERALQEGMLLITDPKGPIGIAGVMGGENSEISENTRDIVLESACFLPASVRATSKALGLNTESAARFIKGVDMNGTALALERASQLIEMLDAGDVLDTVIDIADALPKERTKIVSVEMINGLLGLELPAKEMAALLKRTFIPCVVQDNDTLVCKIPAFRQDIGRACDIAEEVARMYGYENIPMTLMRGDLLVGSLSAQEAQGDRAKAQLCAQGFYETLTYSFTGPREYDALGLDKDDPLRNSVQISNPFGEDQSLMRTTMLPGMLGVVALNIARKNTRLALFEVGTVFLPKALPLTDLPEEKQMLCLALYGQGEDFFSLKGAVESVAACLNIEDLAFEADGPEYLHPGQKARVTVAGRQAGYIGCLHPDVCDNFDIPGRVYVGELDYKAFMEAASAEITSTALPRYPAVERDLALVMDIDTPAGPVAAMMKKTGGALVESVTPFDVYTGGQIGGNKKSVAFALVFRAPDRTLTDEEVSAV